MENILIQEKNKLDEKIKKICRGVFFEISSKNYLQNIRLKYLESNFTLSDFEIERYLILGDDFYNFVSYKLSKV